MEKFKGIFKAIFQTPYFRCDPSANTEIHTLTGRKHLWMYILAIKSFLRFCDDVAVVVHDDGTLSSAHKALLKRHIKGIRIITYPLANKKMKILLKQLPYSRKYRDTLLNAKQLFDYNFFSNADKIISLDSDTLFFKKPGTVMRWASGRKKENVYFSERALNYPPKLEEGLYLCSGLLCFYRKIFNFNDIESSLAHKSGTFHWFTVQDIYDELLQANCIEYEISSFDNEQYQDPPRFKKDAVFRHYWLHDSLLLSRFLDDCSIVLREIFKKGRCGPML